MAEKFLQWRTVGRQCGTLSERAFGAYLAKHSFALAARRRTRQRHAGVPPANRFATILRTLSFLSWRYSPPTGRQPTAPCSPVVRLLEKIHPPLSRPSALSKNFVRHWLANRLPTVRHENYSSATRPPSSRHWLAHCLPTVRHWRNLPAIELSDRMGNFDLGNSNSNFLYLKLVLSKNSSTIVEKF